MPDRAVRRRRIVAAVLLAGGVVAGCGGDRDAGEGAGDDTSSDLRPCAEIWVLGEKLPADYVACDDGVEGYNPESGYWHCADGTEVWQEAASKYFASKGTRIRADQGGALHAHLSECGALDGVS